MAIEIKLDKKESLFLLAGAVLLALLLGAYAYNSTGVFNNAPSNAPIFGHSADELVVQMADGSGLKTVQELLSNGFQRNISGEWVFGGMYTYNDEYQSCQTGNYLLDPSTNLCQCPSGYASQPVFGNGLQTIYYCFKQI